MLSQNPLLCVLNLKARLLFGGGGTDPKITIGTMLLLFKETINLTLFYTFFGDQYKKGKVIYVNLYQMYFMYPLTLEA